MFIIWLLLIGEFVIPPIAALLWRNIVDPYHEKGPWGWIVAFYILSLWTGGIFGLGALATALALKGIVTLWFYCLEKRLQKGGTK